MEASITATPAARRFGLAVACHVSATVTLEARNSFRKPRSGVPTLLRVRALGVTLLIRVQSAALFHCSRLFLAMVSCPSQGCPDDRTSLVARIGAALICWRRRAA